jgi:hypothetical protein
MSEKRKRKVFILTATYKVNDPVTIGAYDSMQAMMRGFAKCVAEEVISESENRGLPFDKLSEKVAVELADLIPAFFDDSYPRDEEGCIRYGKTTYGYETMDVESVEDFVEKEDGEVDS